MNSVCHLSGSCDSVSVWYDVQLYLWGQLPLETVSSAAGLLNIELSGQLTPYSESRDKKSEGELEIKLELKFIFEELDIRL